ncbi:MAG: putative tRNA threonylcarbamoyladenosine biosynthesis protein Gcp [candidate division TM6 bacterium GW2011_GWE2_42_60]|nr:MAG: putative tRNA threonylcarbamoyladenosine biosynthesis protein Gcp [candidate division TM6 bacterium GW2011_GWE2_42_60]
MSTTSHLILGIETSCDETAAAVYQTGFGVRSSLLFTQIELHRPYGGVMPEVASRSHIEKIHLIVEQALSNASTTLAEIDAIAVATGPGLPGSLLVGSCFAKALAYESKKPLIAVNHIEAHVFSPLIENTTVPFPHLCLTASGGHTALFYVEDFGKYSRIGTTLDDSAGEAFDKVAKLIGLSYPGGPLIEQLARQEHFKDSLHYPRLKKKSLNFSFSGLKTAVLYDLIERGAFDLKTKTFLATDDPTLIRMVASSFLVCVGDIFVDRIAHALTLFPDCKAITFAGGVSCNRYLNDRIAQIAHNHRISFFSPAKHYCTDNAAMVAFVGSFKMQQGCFSPLSVDIKPQGD